MIYTKYAKRMLSYKSASEMISWLVQMHWGINCIGVIDFFTIAITVWLYSGLEIIKYMWVYNNWSWKY